MPLTSAEIRRAYIDFFVRKHGHTEVPSSPVVPHDDPTLLFTNAGMNQFKPIFLGQEKRPYTRAVDTQKCIRAGGKHNDLDDVGRSRRHHTFFEMLGNWSFGDYFKRGAIGMSWELLTDVFQLDPTRIHVTCYEGDAANGVPRDTEAANLWKEIANLPDDHIHFLGKDNFWEMGDTGPCGPCTEIFYDRTPDKTGGPTIRAGDDPRVMEFWNNVFIQYNRNADRTLVELPAQHVDTGMGFERIVQILQDADSNYSIDLWHPFWAKLTELSDHTYTSKFPPTNSVDAVAEAADEGLRKDIAFRVIGDHARCLTFALTDGAVPSNEGRGYVLRRILRRAYRFGRQSLGLNEPFLYKMVDVVVASMGDAFPELKANPRRVADMIKDEEISFGRTLDRGIQLFQEASARTLLHEYAKSKDLTGVGLWRDTGTFWLQLARRGENVAIPSIDVQTALVELRSAGLSLGQISPDDAFKLHDTFGFPIDLTQIMAAEVGQSVDLANYEMLMEAARAMARAGGKTGDDSVYDVPPGQLARLEADGVPRTDDKPKYTTRTTPAKVVAVWTGCELLDETTPGQQASVLLDRTSFYAEMGGQVGDTGTITPRGGATSVALSDADTDTGKALTPILSSEYTGEGARFDVTDTHNTGGYVLHIGTMTAGTLKVGDVVTAEVTERRESIENNHTATHLLNLALKQQLGPDIGQKGSLVDADKLRFDFSYGKPLTEAELDAVEAGVGQRVGDTAAIGEGGGEGLVVHTAEVPQEQALKINGLRAVFGEKYPPVVRVVSVGVPVADLLADPASEKWPEYSIEFCGGTHVPTTRHIGRFAVIAEESVSKGVRRITAVTGEKAVTAWADVDAVYALLDKTDAAADADVPAMVQAINQAISTATLPLSAKRRAQARVVALQARAKAAEKAAKGQSAGVGVDAIALAGQLLDGAIDLGGGKVVVGEIAGATDDQLRSAVDSLKKRAGSYGILLGAAGEKVSFVAAVSDDMIAKGLKAGDWIRETAKVAGGGGGGRPQMAQAGGKDPAKLGEALDRARAVAVGILA